MKKWEVLLLSGLMAVSVSACGGNKETKKTAEESSATETSQESTVKNELEYISDGDSVTDASVFGENTFVFSPEDDIETVKKKVDEVYKKQESNQFGDERYSLMFLPGEYDSTLKVNVGYYTQVSGLGVSPIDTNIRGLWVNADWMWHNATCNFWRGAENFTIDGYCMWANSQAVSMRRVNSHNGAVLSDGEGWSSGGFIADSKFEGMVSSGSQQQYLFRNDDWKYFENGVWNMVFTGVNVNKLPMGSWPYAPYTRIENTPVIQEKPYLCYDGNHGYGVIVPERRTDCQGISWEQGVKGKFFSLNKFYIADPKKDTADTLNAALKEGKNLLLTPGIYSLDKAIEVTNPDTIVYGMGLATLEAKEGNACMEVADVDGVKVCGLLFDAGEKESETLLKIGAEDSKEDHSANPSVYSDVYFRVGGGKYAGKVQSCVVVNSNDVIGDNFWVWRADHSMNVGWDMNTAPNGIIINGDNVTMYGLFVEHFQEYQTVWNGNGGRCYFYQSEMPYDAPEQKAYLSHDGKKKGYASFKVDDKVTSFEGYGLGIYCYNRDAEIEIDSAAEVPKVDGVKIHNICTVKLNGHGQINHIVNDEGEATLRGGNACRIMEYENGIKENN